MKALLLVILIAGCETARGGNLDGNQLRDGFFADDDLSVGDLAQPAIDLRGADLVGIDMAARDMATAAGDMALRADGSATAATPDTCAGALAVVPGIEYVDQDSTGLANNLEFSLNAGCGSGTSYKAPDAIYSIAVPNGKKLTVRVQPSALGGGQWDPAIMLLTDCNNAASCVAGIDDALPISKPEILSYTNSSGTQQTIYIVVDSYLMSFQHQGIFSILAVVE